MGIVRALTYISMLTGITVSIVSSTASAHVSVRPEEVVTAGFQTFTVSAPNEKDIAFTSIRLDIPAGLKHVTPTVKPGWQINTDADGSGEGAAIKAITWSGNSVPAGFREDFSFSAQAPATASELQWKAYQTYSDGVTISWDLTEKQQPKNADGSPDFSKSGPFSVTKVAKEAEPASKLHRAEQATADARKAADRALYVGIAGLAVGLVGIALATRKR